MSDAKFNQFISIYASVSACPTDPALSECVCSKIARSRAARANDWLFVYASHPALPAKPSPPRLTSMLLSRDLLRIPSDGHSIIENGLST